VPVAKITIYSGLEPAVVTAKPWPQPEHYSRVAVSQLPNHRLTLARTSELYVRHHSFLI